ncbi:MULTISPECIES: polyphosphate:AMP phosphotransferase [Microvirgula]|uniref:Polyphosphate:AMP phosphotransferase n=1 Tax=Microvirgula aerodenitrificans TaxID=57480 RepID=A0A2S0P9V0_9NEIS|nr:MULTISPECIES: polyphosphate:AMP phosphotransferase [Microvirgula]AVY94170.1 polyphosphate:AMP phosphotransferase [Microvirgula aerodenitrificans]RAS15568.1 polyphosphate:AMP phosphotransferase [Microvirgula sp. AG722]
MFESAELGHHLGREAYEAEVSELREALLDAQHELKERAAGPVIILINGMDGAGRSETLAQIDAWLDPRLVPVYAQTAMFADPVDEATGRPWLWRYWNALPPRGQIGVYFGSWYSDVLFGRVYGQTTEQQALQALAETLMFEKQLAAEGASIVKFWLHLSKADQKNRLKSLEKDPATRWRVSERDWQHVKDYDAIRAEAERMLRATSIAESPWVVVEGLNARYREITVGRTLLNMLKAGLEHNAKPVVHDDTPPLLPPVDGVMLLDTLQLDQPLDKSEYKARLAELQSRLAQLTREAAFANHSLLIAFEGNDAAGKGGAIRRLAMALDARRYRIIPVAAPTEEERAKPWLWRFWRHVPKRGGISIFDRTWYGRVLVERVEGFCREVDWMRAYNEINDFERQLHAAGAIVVKFWLTISKEEQLARFKAREETGFKRFKITDEDWRNRDKWDDYKLAVCDMIDRTSTHHSPWTLVEANNKYYARIKVLETVCAAIEKRLAEGAKGSKKGKLA